MTAGYHIGADENGLGARLGPLVVTAVLARVEDEKVLRRKLPARLARDINDSKRLVAHGNVELGEAWARVLTGEQDKTPMRLFERLSLEGSRKLKEPCPKSAESQCWQSYRERFHADSETLERLRRALAALQRKGIEPIRVKSSVVCTRVLNDERAQGKNRFTSDLHAMERLVLDLREEAGENINAVCGKVGGMSDYSRYFGPLSLRLHAVIKQSRQHSAYSFPGLGQLHFVQDADERNPLVMLASLVGKYVRELLMGKISQYYQALDDAEPGKAVSGYNDPVTKAFIARSLPVLDSCEIPLECFERAGDAP